MLFRSGGYGCGPTAMAMAVASLTDIETDPATMAQWAAEQRSEEHTSELQSRLAISYAVFCLKKKKKINKNKKK